MEGEMAEVSSVLKLFSIKGFGLPLIFIYLPTVIKETGVQLIRDKARGR